MTPLLARHVARSLAQQHPGLGKDEIAAKMRADLGHAPSVEEARFIDAVVSRWRENPQVESPRETPVSAWVLVAANLVPLFGVLFFGWPLVALLALFWLENVVIGVLNVARMLLADPSDAALWAAKLFMVPFFCVHYGIFTAVHGAFVLSMFGGKYYDLQESDVIGGALRAASYYDVWLPLGVLAGSHVFSFFWNYLYRGEFRRAQLARLMAQPYGRVIVLHVAILAGGFAAAMLGSPVWALVLLLALKIGLDLRAHLKEHSKT